MTRISIPSPVSQLAYTTAGDVSRLTSTLNGTSTFLALCSAEQAAVRAMDNLRTIRAHIRDLKRQASIAEKASAVRANIMARDSFEIPA